MAIWKFEFTVENAYEVLVKADNPAEATAAFEKAYDEFYEGMAGSEFVECGHTIHHVSRVEGEREEYWTGVEYENN